MLFLPLLPADRWLREHDAAPTPRVFIEKQRGAMRILAVDETALALGIAPGMMLADARARVPDLAVSYHDPEGDARLLGRLADLCGRYTPMVALDPPDGLILDITGCTHLWDSEADLLSDLAARLTDAGFTFRIALAETPDKARALVRHGGDIIRAGRANPPHAVNEERASYTLDIRDLSSRALELDEDQAAALRRAGLYTIGDLASRPRKPLAARFGMAAVTKLARLLGEEDVRIGPHRVAPALSVLRRFAEPVARTEHVLDILADLASEASERLRERDQGGRRFVASLFRSDGDVRRLAIETGAPARDPALLLRLFRERIETLADPLDPGFGYDAVRLDVAASEPLAANQPGFDGREKADAEIGALIDRLATRLGATRVRKLIARDTHIPEAAADTLPVHDRTATTDWFAPEPGEPPLRPLHLFDPPQPIEVMAEVPDGPPLSFRWKRQTHRIRLSEGPERIAPEWWRRKAGYEPGKSGPARDYYRVEDNQGCRFWLFRRGRYSEAEMPGWYLHGAFV